MFMYFKCILLRLRLLVLLRQYRHYEQQEEEQQLLDRYWARSLAGYHSLFRGIASTDFERAESRSETH